MHVFGHDKMTLRFQKKTPSLVLQGREIKPRSNSNLFQDFRYSATSDERSEQNVEGVEWSGGLSGGGG